MRNYPLVAGAIAAALLAASCRAEANVGLVVEEDRSGAVTIELGTDQELRDAVESLGATPDELMAEFDIPALEGGYEREEGSMTFQGVRIEFDDVSEVETAIAESASALAEFSSFSFTMDDSSAVFDATLIPPDLGAISDLPFDVPNITGGDFLSAGFTLAMPGTVTEHNADEVLADGRLRWDIAVLAGEQSQLHAESDFGGGGFPWLFVILGIVVLVGVGAMIGAVAMGRRQEQRAVSDAAAAHTAGD